MKYSWLGGLGKLRLNKLVYKLRVGRSIKRRDEGNKMWWKHQQMLVTWSGRRGRGVGGVGLNRITQVFCVDPVDQEPLPLVLAHHRLHDALARQHLVTDTSCKGLQWFLACSKYLT